MIRISSRKGAVALLRRAAVLLGIIVMSSAMTPAQAQVAETDVFTIARGGLLYDNLWSVTEHDPPKDTHPAYPAEGKKSGGSTWRCKECHGWDYRGVDGAYGSGSHYSGVKGIRRMVGADPEKIAAIIRDKTHGYTKEMISDGAVEKLATFVSLGQVDMEQYIDRVTKMARGDSSRGARLYQTVCAVCHGFDGKEINFKDEAKPEFIGTVGSENPWETLHKIRNGQPGVPMVSMGALSLQDQVDILAYTQTLPAE